MGIQAMIATLKANKRKKRVQFDKNRITTKGQSGDFVDYKKMNTYEFAAFQKKIFKEKRLQKRKYYLIIVLTLIVVAVVILILPSILSFIFAKFDQPY